MSDNQEKSKLSKTAYNDRAVDSMRKAIQNAPSVTELYNLKSSFLGKNSELVKQMSLLKDVKSLDEKRKKGQTLNTIYQTLSQDIQERLQELDKSAWQECIRKNTTDFTLDSRHFGLGSMHPIRAMAFRVNRVLQDLGFRFVDAPYLDDIFYNFEALNIPLNHPARQDMCTFYLENDNKTVLRTHATNAQIHWLKQNKQPCKIFNTGQVFRNDSDKTHNPVFHQNDILVMDSNVTMEDLLSNVQVFLARVLFEHENLRLRIRPSYFPFTEPSAEVDIWADGRWLEVMGCGMMHPNVFRSLDINPEHMKGYAWGVGIDRLAMLTYGFHDLRQALDSDYRWIKNFGISTF